MGFFSKDKPEVIADTLFGYTLGLIDSIFSLPVICNRTKLNLSEIYIFVFWLQVVNVISAGGGVTDHVQKVLGLFAEKAHTGVVNHFLISGRLHHADIPAFEANMRENFKKRRNFYDETFRANKDLDYLSAIVITNIVGGQISEEETTVIKGALSSWINSAGPFCIEKLKKII
jgi:hypothetical protein